MAKAGTVIGREHSVEFWMGVERRDMMGSRSRKMWD
jgi:hypothetical protein